MTIPAPLAFPPSALRGVTAGGVVGNEIGSSGTRGKVLSSAQLKAIVEASGISYLPLSGGTLTGGIVMPQGSLQSGGLSFSGSGGANIYGRGQAFVFGTANVRATEIAWDYTRVCREAWIGWSNGSFDATNNTVRVSLFADAVGTLSQRNGLNAQCFDLFETYTSSTNNGKLRFKATSSGHQIGSARAASGSNRAVQLGHFDAADVFTRAITIATSGLVGVNVDPVSPFHVKQNANNYTGGITLENTGGSQSTFWAGTAGLVIDSGTLGLLVLQTGSANRVIVDSSGIAVTGGISTTGAITPATLTDAAAPNGSIYYSSTQSKLVYKNSGGTVNVLY